MTQYTRKPYALFSLTALACAIGAHAAEMPPPAAELEQENLAPVIHTSSLKNAREGQRYQQQIDASDAESMPLSYSLLQGPAGMSISSKGVINWLPEFDAAGSHAVKVQVSDGDLITTATLTLKVENTNRPPEWQSSSLPAAKEGSSYSAELAASDADGDNLSFTLKQGPAGLSISGDGKLSWKPGFDAAGEHPVVISVSDGGRSAEQSFTLAVENTNRTPSWQSKNLAAGKEGENYSAQLNASDADGDALSYTLISGPQGLSLSSNGEINWQPDYDSAGSHSLNVSVSDGEAESSADLSLQIANTNRAPEIVSTPAATGAEAASYSYTIEASDADGDNLSFSLIAAPQGMTLSGNTLNWIPGYTQAGNHKVRIAVKDSETQAEQNFTLAIANTNREPQWQTSSLPQGKENQAYSAQLKATDADGDALTYTLENGPQGLSVSADGKLNWQPDFDSAGSHNISLSVSDGESSTALELPLSIANTNRKPAFTSEPVAEGAEASPYQYTVTSADPDGDPLTLRLIKGPNGLTLDGDTLNWSPNYDNAGAYTVLLELADAESSVQQKYLLKIANTNRAPEITLPAAEKRSTEETRNWSARIGLQDADGDTIQLKLLEGPQGMTLSGDKLSFTPSYEQAGEHRVVLEASDKQDSTVDEFLLSVANRNRKPAILNTASGTANENSLYSHQVTARDADATPLSYSLLQAPEGMTISEEGLIEWIPNFDQAGKHNVQIQVSDGEDAASQSFSISVANTNRAPVFNSEPETLTAENSNYNYDIDATDPDHSPVKLRLLQAPQGMKLSGTTLSWQPNFNNAGSYSVAIGASDGSTEAKQEFTLSVSNTNRPPEITSKPTLSAMESVTYSYPVMADDADGESLTMRLLQAPKGMTLTNGKIAWTPDFNAAGSHPVTLAVSDGMDDTQQSFTIKVADTNREPNLADISNQTLREGKTFKQRLQGSDVDGGNVTFKLIYGPKGMRIEDGDMLYWETQRGDAGTYTVIVSVSDGDLKVRKHFDIVVEAK